MQNSSFSIRFKPACAAEREDKAGTVDEVCDINDGRLLSRNGSCEAVLFERLPEMEEQIPTVNCSESRPASHPSSLWKSSQALYSHSAPVSELTSPMSPSAANASIEKPASGKPLAAASPPFAEKFSLFSGLKEKLDRLSTESWEIFDRRMKMKRSGSADAAKIASILADTDAMTSNEAKSHTEKATSDVTDSEQDEQMPEDTEHSVNGESSVSALVSGYVHKSVSSIEVTKADIVSSSPKKRASLGNELNHDTVVMSHLLSKRNHPENRGHFADSAVISTSELPNDDREVHLATNTHYFRKLKRCITGALLQYSVSFLVAVVTYVIIPLPTFVDGMLVGALLSAISIFVYLRLTRSRESVSHFTVRPSSSITADVKESKNVEGLFQVCTAQDTV